MKPDITIAIPTYQRSEILLNTVHEVLNQSYKNLELLVIDQSIDLTPAALDALKSIKDSRFRYTQVDPPSLTAARNFALQAALAPIVLFLDDDVKLQKDMVAQHLKAFARHPQISAVGGRVMQTDFPVKRRVLKFDEYAVSHGVFTATEPGFTNAFPGGNHAIKVADALEVGGYDSRYYGNAFREESDMSLKLTRHGKKIYYEPGAELLHLALHSGGLETRAKGHLYDSWAFYRNELFFTLRAVRLGKKLVALRIKYREYCIVPSKRTRLKRSVYFLTGLLAGCWRICFGRRVVSRERI